MICLMTFSLPSGLTLRLLKFWPFRQLPHSHYPTLRWSVSPCKVWVLITLHGYIYFSTVCKLSSFWWKSQGFYQNVCTCMFINMLSFIRNYPFLFIWIWALEFVCLPPPSPSLSVRVSWFCGNFENKFFICGKRNMFIITRVDTKGEKILSV